MEEDFRAFLVATLGIPVHWRRQPITQDVFPYVNLSFISAPTAYSLDGADGKQEASIQIDTWSKTYGGTVALARQAAAALSGYSGLSGSTHFDAILKEGEFDRDALLIQDDASSQIHNRSVDYRVIYS